MKSATMACVRSTAANSLLTLILVFLASCGGGGGGNSGGNSMPMPPPGPLSYPSPQVYSVAVAVTPLNPSITGTVTAYAASPALPAGLTLNSITGQISGTPTKATAATDYQITASNSGGSSTFTLNITVNLTAPSSFSYSSPQTYTVGTAITPLSPSVKGPVSSYSVSPALPAGLALDTTTGQITGTPTTVTATAAYTITAQNTAGSATFSLTITVNDIPPNGLSYSSPQSYWTGVAITPLNPTVQGNVTNYSVSPALPAGLSLNATTGQITGTPTAPSASTTYVLTASNSGGTATFNLSITVALSPPSALSYPSPIWFAVNSTLVPVSPSVQGIVTQYRATPALPPGVSLDSVSGVISGTPTATQGPTTYTITAQNSAGSTASSVSIAVVTLNVSPGTISRLVASGSAVTVAMTLTPVDFSFTGTLYAKVTDATATFNPTVTVSSSAGAYAASLTTSPSAGVSHNVSNLILNFCSDPACTMPQTLRAITIPFDVNILASNSPWPGNNLTTLSAWSGIADWTMFQGNAAHTGYVDVTLDPNQFSTRWQGPAISGSGIGPYYPNNNTLAASNGVFFIPSGSKLYARRESDAAVVWSYDFSSLQFPSANPVAVANGTVYIAAGQQSSTYLFALSAADGSLVFKSPMSSQWENYLAPTIGPQGIYTDAGTYGGIYGFNTSGTQLFFQGLAQTDEWTPAVDANHVYAYTGNALTLLDPVNGSQQLSIADPTFTNYVYAIGGSVVLGAPGYAFAANYANSVLNSGTVGNTLLGFDTGAGTIRWEIPGNYPSTPAYHAGVVYAANENPMRLEARAEADGSLLWSWTPPQAGDTTFTSEVLLTRNMAFVSTNLAIYGVDTTTHKTVWSYPLIGRLALSANGVLYIQNSGPLTAINLK